MFKLTNNEKSDGKTEFDRKPFTVIFECLLSAVIMFFCSASSLKYPSFGKQQEKNCFSNIRVLTGAVEMYNLDNTIPMTEFNEDINLTTLIKEKYLKGIKHPEEECWYLSEGDLEKDGFIYCQFHGDIGGKLKEQNKTIPYEVRYSKRFKRELTNYYLFLIGLTSFIPLIRLIIAFS